MRGPNAIGEPLERKYTLVACSTQTIEQHDEHHAMVFLAKDRALPATLAFYRAECKRIGAAWEQLHALDLLIQRVERYQAAYQDRVKTPDVDPVRGAAILNPNRQDG